MTKKSHMYIDNSGVIKEGINQDQQWEQDPTFYLCNKWRVRGLPAWSQQRQHTACSSEVPDAPDAGTLQPLYDEGPSNAGVVTKFDETLV